MPVLVPQRDSACGNALRASTATPKAQSSMAPAKRHNLTLKWIRDCKLLLLLRSPQTDFRKEQTIGELCLLTIWLTSNLLTWGEITVSVDSKSLPPLHMVRPSKAPERSRPKKALANLDLGWAQNAVCGLLFKRTLGFQAPQEVFRRLGKILNKA